MRLKKALLVVLSTIFLAYGFGISHSQKSLSFTKQEWLEDLHYAAKTLIAKHPDIFYRISEARFEKSIVKAEQKIKDSQTDEECLTTIRQFVASIHDGHTSLDANNLPGYRDIYPVRMYEFSDGIFITGIAKKYAEYVGAKVLKIGHVSAGEAFNRARTLTFADNEFSKKNQAPQIVVACKLAYGLGITESADKLSLVIETTNGLHEKILIAAVTPPGAMNMLNGMDIGPAGIPFVSAFTGTDKELPLYLKHLDGNHNYWFEHDKENRAIYMQFNLVRHQRDESFDEFYARMFDYYDNNADSIDTFILDLRFNNGGNGLMVLPFINEIIKREKINRLGHFYTLVGRRSFSAAVLLIAEMMHHTNILLVGEPAGAAQNMFSDTVNRGTLPNSGVSLNVSSAYLNIAWPANKNYMIPPHYPVLSSSLDFFSGKDPALEEIFANKAKAVEMVLYEEGPRAALKFFKNIKLDWGAHTSEWSITPFTFPISKKYNGETKVNDMGYQFMNQNRMEDAGAVFELNTILFPKSSNAWDSYAEYFMRIGDNSNAIKYYMKSLVLNPSNVSATNRIRQLKKKLKI
jgi:tetratricopeptide (TPR) repeat protein